jgi:hypothetical protein
MDKFSWKMVVNPLYWVAFLIFIGRQARKRTYHGIFPGVITYPLGLAFSVMAFITTMHLVGDDMGIGWYGWVPAALIASSLVSGFIWPIAYSIADIVGDTLKHITKPLAEHVLGPLVGMLRSLPGASSIWKHVESTPEPGKTERKWFTTFLLGATYVVGTLACGYVGYLTAEFGQALLANTAVSTGVLGMILGNGWIIGGFAGVIVARLLFQPLHDTLDKAEVNGLTFIWSTIVGYYGAILLGSTLLTQIAIGAGIFAVNAALVFPIVLLFFNEGLKKLGELLKPVVENTYRGDKNDLRLFFHHAVNIVVAIGLAVGAFILGGMLEWNIWLTYGFTALTLVASYLSVVHVIKHSGGNAIIGFLTSVALGLGAFDLYLTHLGWFDWLGGVIAGVFAAAAWGLALLPLLYSGLGLFFDDKSTAGAALDKAHEKASANLKKLYEKGFKRAQEATFNDKTEFKPLFGQVSNVLFAGVVFYFAYFVGLPHADAGWTHWLALAGTVLVTATSYLVGGKLAKHDGGEPLIVLLCVGAGLYIGGNAFGMLPWAWYFALPTAAVLAIVAGYALGLFVIPPVYALLKVITLAIPDKTDGKGWKAGIATLFKYVHQVIYDFVDKWVLRPVNAAVERIAKVLAPIISAVSRAYNDIMQRIDRIFGRGKRA